MATRQEVRGWARDASGDLSLSEEEFDKLLTEMLESGELEIHEGLYYIAEKGYFEYVYGKYQYFDFDGKGKVTDVRDHKKSLHNKDYIKE